MYTEPAVLIEHHTEAPRPNYTIPYDKAPFEAVAYPGETIALYGRIELFNNTPDPILARTYFDLCQGFILTVEDETYHLLQEKVRMHHHYTLQTSNDIWTVTERQKAAPNTVEQPETF